MPAYSLPPGWKSKDEHPEHGELESGEQYYTNNEGGEVVVWKDEDKTKDYYVIMREDRFFVEVHIEGRFIDGDAFNEETQALDFAFDSVNTLNAED